MSPMPSNKQFENLIRKQRAITHQSIYHIFVADELAWRVASYKHDKNLVKDGIMKRPSTRERLARLMRSSAGEDTALAPLIPRLLAVLEGGGKGQVRFDDIAAVGETYVQTMRRRFSSTEQPKRIVDKMLRNAWNIGYIAFMLPKVKLCCDISVRLRCLHESILCHCNRSSMKSYW